MTVAPLLSRADRFQALEALEVSEGLWQLASAEGSAGSIVFAEPTLIPEILQTEAYADVLLKQAESPPRAERMLAVLKGRQEALRLASTQIRLHFLGMTALRNQVGSAEVMAGQLDGLIATRDIIHIVPDEAGVWRSGTLALLRDEQERLSGVYVGDPLSSSFYTDQIPLEYAETYVQSLERASHSREDSMRIILREQQRLGLNVG